MKKLLQESLVKIDALENQVNNLLQAYAKVMLMGGVDPDQLIEDIHFLLTYDVDIESTPELREMVQSLVQALQTQQESH
jgi:hypothetical protein